MNGASVGAVIIGRNEGERLRTCLGSIIGQVEMVVYVDSGSTDGSPELARAMGAEIVALDLSRPFTAARARNAGLHHLLDRKRELAWVQFVDGDCELDPMWLSTALAFLENDERAAVACGRRRERFPEASAYNRLCDMEWDTPVGQTASCGGDALIRVAAIRQVDGYDESLIAGEEPDLCFRMRSHGWTIHRLAAEMTLHDAAMTRASQWWLRSKRSGYAAAEASARRGDAEPHLRRRMISNLLWSLPVAWPFWPLLWLKIWRQRGALYASHIVLGKVPHLLGQAAYWLDRVRRRRRAIIEYK